MQPKTMPEAEYKEYCRCWKLFLDRIIWRDKRFAAVMTNRAADLGARVRAWPTNWGDVQHIFAMKGDSDWTQAAKRFVEAVQVGSKP